MNTQEKKCCDTSCCDANCGAGKCCEGDSCKGKCCAENSCNCGENCSKSSSSCLCGCFSGRCHGRSKRVLKIVGILLAVYLAVLSIKEIKSINYVGTDPQQSHTISVDGTGNAVAIPDIATLSFTVTETSKTVASAQTLATTKVNTTVAALKAAGVADKDIQTTSYNINPHYEYQSSVCTSNGICPPSKTIITGYDVSQSTDIKVRDLTKIGDLLTIIGSNSVQNVSGPSFSVENPDIAQAVARAKAIDNAKIKADVLAKALGVRIVRVVSFSESGNTPYPIRYDMAGGAMSASAPKMAPEISTGEQKITSNVNITYEIE